MHIPAAQTARRNKEGADDVDADSAEFDAAVVITVSYFQSKQKRNVGSTKSLLDSFSYNQTFYSLLWLAGTNRVTVGMIGRTSTVEEQRTKSMMSRHRTGIQKVKFASHRHSGKNT